MFRVCHDLLSVFGFGFSLLCESRLFGVVVVAMYPLSVFFVRHGCARIPYSVVLPVCRIPPLPREMGVHIDGLRHQEPTPVA
jgi:hypothetical protein